jgi:hypothetical protein
MRAPTSALAATLALLVPFAARAEPSEVRPFAPGERLEYGVAFGPFRVRGTGTLRVEGPECRADTEPSVLLRFDVDAEIGGQRVSHHARSWLSTVRFASLAYEMNEQSPLGRGTARWEHPGAGAATSLPLDELSFIYLLRTLPLPEAGTLHLDRHYDAARNPVRVRVVRRELKRLGGLPVRTVLVEMRVRDPRRFQGGEGALRIHLTDDAARIPVRLEIPSPLGPNLVLELRAPPSTLARKEP